MSQNKNRTAAKHDSTEFCKAKTGVMRKAFEFQSFTSHSSFSVKYAFILSNIY
jgi:hypothetical protein